MSKGARPGIYEIWVSNQPTQEAAIASLTELGWIVLSVEEIQFSPYPEAPPKFLLRGAVSKSCSITGRKVS